MRPTETNKAVLQTSLTFLYNTNGRWMKAPVTEAVDKLPEEEKETLINTMNVLHMYKLMNEGSREAIENIIDDMGNARDIAYIKAAESLAKTVKDVFGSIVLQALIPTEGMNHRVRQSLMRKGCETLAAACDNRIGSP